MVDLVFQTSGKHSISVHHTKNCDGGGKSFGQRYIDIIKIRYPNRTFNNCLDWCSGPGFIGFSLLSHDICQKLNLVDYYQPAIDCAKKTINKLPDHLRDHVQVHQINDLTLFSPSGTFDLIVANPPHFPAKIPTKLHLLNHLYCSNTTPDQKEKISTINGLLLDYDNTNRITVDKDWQAHKNFYKNIKSHLALDGVILMQENAAGSNVKEFESMIDQAGLEITDVFVDDEYGNFIPSLKIYYIEIKHKKL
jgi:methylase of polypeptide subunit release factors